MLIIFHHKEALYLHYDNRAFKNYKRPRIGFEEVSLTSLTEKLQLPTINN